LVVPRMVKIMIVHYYTLTSAWPTYPCVPGLRG
jgi:hypothetical protein